MLADALSMTRRIEGKLSASSAYGLPIDTTRKPLQRNCPGSRVGLLNPHERRHQVMLPALRDSADDPRLVLGAMHWINAVKIGCHGPSAFWRIRLASSAPSCSRIFANLRTMSARAAKTFRRRKLCIRSRPGFGFLPCRTFAGLRIRGHKGIRPKGPSPTKMYRRYVL